MFAISFYRDLPQTYGIALFGGHRAAKLAVRGKIVPDLPQWQTSLFFYVSMLPKYMSQWLKVLLEIPIFIRLDLDLF
jgi:hypothetical protein